MQLLRVNFKEIYIAFGSDMNTDRKALHGIGE
jgi:hypothetical protein